MAQDKPLTKGYIGLVQNNSLDLKFQFNPQTIRYNRRGSYAKNAAARADFPNASTSAVPAIEWIRNEAEDISIDLIFHKDGDQDVEAQLRRLDQLMEPDKSSGEPRDLVLSLGRADRVRIIEKDVIGKLFTKDLRCQEATVNLRLTALKSRSK